MRAFPGNGTAWARRLIGLAMLAPASGAQAQDAGYSRFVQCFETARAGGDQTGMERAVRDVPGGAVVHFQHLCLEHRRRASDDAAAVMAALEAAFGRVHGSVSGLEAVAQFCRDLTPESEALLHEREAELLQCLAARRTLSGASDPGQWQGVRDRIVAVARAFEQIGDLRQAADAWAHVGMVCHDMPGRSEADDRWAFSAIARFVELRDKWGLRDAVYEQNLRFVESLRALHAEAAASVGQVLAQSLGAAAPERICDLHFAVEETPEPGCSFRSGPVPVLWAEVELRGEDPAPLSLSPPGALRLMRLGAQRFGVSAGDALRPGADAVTPVHASSRPAASLLRLGVAGQPYAMWFYLGHEREPFMQAELNLTPDRERAIVFYRSAASWVARIEGQVVTFYDDNCDGRLFTPDPYACGVRVRTLGDGGEHGTLVPTHDSMRVGRGPRVPFSAVTRIGSTWYLLRAVGDRLGVRPLDSARLKVGRVALKWSGKGGAAPELLIVHGTKGIAGAAFDVAAGAPIEVPAGEYELGFGRIAVGRGAGVQTADVFRGDSPPFEVRANQTFALEMGAPFHVDFARGGRGEDLEIDVSTLRVLDRRGAVYAHLHGAVLSPSVVVAPRPDGRGAKAIGRLVPVVDADHAMAMANRLPGLARWSIAFPVPQGDTRGDHVFQRRLGAAALLVGLRQDRHPLFGAMPPVFK